MENKLNSLAEEYHVGMSTIHGAESFYEFLRPEHKEKESLGMQRKRLHVCWHIKIKLKEKLVSKIR